MKLFGKCIWHNWVCKEVYYDCSDICFWSSGTEYYRQCKDCGLTQKKKYEGEYCDTRDKYIINLFEKSER